MKHLLFSTAIVFIFFIAGCKKEETPKPWKIKIEDGTDLYNYSGITYNPAISDGSSAAFSSEASFGSSGSVINYTTRSNFIIRLGNITKINFELQFSTADSAIIVGLKQSNANNVRFNAFKQMVKPGTYTNQNSIATPFVFYTDKTDILWVIDRSQSNIVEVVSVAPNTQDEMANALIVQINFDIAVRDINFTKTKKIKGNMFSFFNLN
jgi:hypothetical protein